MLIGRIKCTKMIWWKKQYKLWYHQTNSSNTPDAEKVLNANYFNSTRRQPNKPMQGTQRISLPRQCRPSFPHHSFKIEQPNRAISTGVSILPSGRKYSPEKSLGLSGCFPCSEYRLERFFQVTGNSRPRVSSESPLVPSAQSF